MALVARRPPFAGRPVDFVLIHHENKGGKVSGAWEGAGDTLLHVQRPRARPHPPLRPEGALVEPHHATTLTRVDGRRGLRGRGQAASSTTTRSPTDSSRQSATNRAQRGHVIEEAVNGRRAATRKPVRDRLLEGGRLVNVVRDDGRECADHADASRRSRRASTSAQTPGSTTSKTPPRTPPDDCATTPAQLRHRLCQPWGVGV